MSGWSVEFLNEIVEAEFDAFPVDIKAKIAHISKLIEEELKSLACRTLEALM